MLSDITQRFFNKVKKFIDDPECNYYFLEFPSFAKYCLTLAGSEEMSLIKPALRKYLATLREKIAKNLESSISSEERLGFLKYLYFYDEAIKILAIPKHFSLWEPTSLTEEKLIHAKFHESHAVLFNKWQFFIYKHFFMALFRVEYMASLHQNESNKEICFVVNDDLNVLFWQICEVNLNDLSCWFSEVELRKLNKRKTLCLQFLLQDMGFDVHQQKSPNFQSGETPLTYLLKKQHYHLVDCVLRREDWSVTAAQNNDNLLELAFAKGRGNLKIFKKLAFTPGMAVNTFTSGNQILLQHVAWYLHGELFFNVLIGHPDIDVNFRDDAGYSMTEYFFCGRIMSQALFIVKMLLRNDFTLNTVMIKDEINFLTAYLFRKIYPLNLSHIEEDFLRKFLAENIADDNLELLQAKEQQTPLLHPAPPEDDDFSATLKKDYFKTTLDNVNILLKTCASLDLETRKRIASVFIQIVFINEKWVSVSTAAPEKTLRFFNIVTQLPKNLQMVVAHHAYDKPGEDITTLEADFAARGLARQLARSKP